MEFLIKCGQCGETATYKHGDTKNDGEIYFRIPWADDDLEIWCDKCNEEITLT